MWTEDNGQSCPGLAVEVFRFLSKAKARRALSLLWVSAVVVTLGGCNRSAKVADTPGERHYEVRGIVRGTPSDHRTVDVEHEDIPGFMPSMTMPFAAKTAGEISKLHVGDAIAFRLNVTQNDSWIDRVRKIAASAVHLPASGRRTEARSGSNSPPRLREGDVMPVFQLIDQDKRKIGLETFLGRPFVITFIFTRCPIPNFCPMISRNFGELQKAIKTASGPITQTRLLTISFDPEFDSPSVLKSYAEHEKADPVIWTFATGDKSEIEQLTHGFSVYVQPEGGTISHGLATALIGPDGIVRQIWRGNGWTPAEVVREINGGSH